MARLIDDEARVVGNRGDATDASYSTMTTRRMDESILSDYEDDVTLTSSEGGQVSNSNVSNSTLNASGTTRNFDEEEAQIGPPVEDEHEAQNGSPVENADDIQSHSVNNQSIDHDLMDIFSVENNTISEKLKNNNGGTQSLQLKENKSPEEKNVFSEIIDNFLEREQNPPELSNNLGLEKKNESKGLELAPKKVIVKNYKTKNGETSKVSQEVNSNGDTNINFFRTHYECKICQFSDKCPMNYHNHYLSPLHTNNICINRGTLFYCTFCTKHFNHVHNFRKHLLESKKHWKNLKLRKGD